MTWSEKYLNSLRDFASVLQLPLLIAWKWNDMWLVVNSAHLEKKVTGYHLDYETALKENLMSFLFGNIWIKVNDRASFRIDAEIIDMELDPNKELIDEGTYTIKVENAGFYIGDELIDQISGLCSEILFSTFVDNVVTKRDGNHLRVVFHQAKEAATVQLSDLFFIDLYMRSREGEIAGNETLLQGPFDSTAESFRNALAQPGTSQFIDLVLDQRPNRLPQFLKESTDASSSE